MEAVIQDSYLVHLLLISFYGLHVNGLLLMPNTTKLTLLDSLLQEVQVFLRTLVIDRFIRLSLFDGFFHIIQQN